MRLFFISNIYQKRRKIVIAHELGHLILHTDLNTSFYTENHLLSKGRIETQADKFAAELLIPDDVEIHEDITIQQLACYLGVPEELVKLKFRKEV